MDQNYPKRITFEERPRGDDPEDPTYFRYCLHIESADTSYLRDPDTVVAPANTKIRFTYPLKRHDLVVITEPAPITRRRFAEIVFREYARIYREEGETTKIPAGYIPGMLNRVQTDGKYGIWGHVIGDLDLVQADLKNGVYNLSVDS